LVAFRFGAGGAQPLQGTGRKGNIMGIAAMFMPEIIAGGIVVGKTIGFHGIRLKQIAFPIFNRAVHVHLAFIGRVISGRTHQVSHGRNIGGKIRLPR